MGDSESAAIARALAERHAAPAEPDSSVSLLNCAERSRTGDWSMRSALTRFAQPHPVRAARVLALVRRLDAALRHIARPLGLHPVTCDRKLSPVSLDRQPVEPYPDTRVADLARLAAQLPAGIDDVLAAYESTTDPLSDTERSALPLLGVALRLDALADVLTDWAVSGPLDPPTDEVDHSCAEVLNELDRLGVPVEQGPSRGRDRRNRGL